MLLIWLILTNPRSTASIGSSSSTGCGDCWCVTNSTVPCPAWQPANYSAAVVAAFNSYKQSTPVQELDNGCNPYKNASCNTVPPLAHAPPSSVCGVQYSSSCGSYALATYPSTNAAKAAGATVTHEGGCGICSTLQDLASYITVPDMTKVGKTCGLEAVLDINLGIKCFQKLGMTKPCARIWAYDAVSDAGPCGATCLKDLKKPYNIPPSCKLNDCLQCDEDHAGPVFKRFAARTRRRSGLISAIQRPCDSVARLTHIPCGSSRSSSSNGGHSSDDHGVAAVKADSRGGDA